MVSNLSISIAQAPSDIRQRVYKVFRLVYADLATRVQEITENLVNALDVSPQSVPLSKLWIVLQYVFVFNPNRTKR